MGSSSVASTIQAALKRNPNSSEKTLELLSLGDRLDIFCYVIKNRQLSTDKELLSDWESATRLRDQAAHFSERVFPVWDKELPILISFLRRYKKLLAVVKPIAEGLQDA